MKALRYAFSALGAAVVTFLLFFEMQSLVRWRDDSPLVVQRSRPVEFVRLRKEPERDTSRPRIKEPPPPLPSVPELDAAAELRPQGQGAPRDELPRPGEGGRRKWEVEIDLAGEPWGADVAGVGEFTPLVRVEPRYPAGALLRGIEGWVLVEFTVSATGSVTDAVVVDSEPGSVFDRAALQAVRKWRYRPSVVDGAPVEEPGVQVRLVFEIGE